MISIKNEDVAKLDILSAKISIEIHDQVVTLVGIINEGREENDFTSSCHVACMNSLKSAYLLGQASREVVTDESPMQKRMKLNKCEDCFMTGGYHYQDCVNNGF